MRDPESGQLTAALRSTSGAPIVLTVDIGRDAVLLFVSDTLSAEWRVDHADSIEAVVARVPFRDAPMTSSDGS